MLILISEKARKEQITSAAEDLDGYIKFVADIKKEILTIGGKRHVDGEQLLLENGSNQSDLWGGGYDTETKQMDYDSIINIRPQDNNSNNEVMSLEIRDKMNVIFNKLVL